jgi:hypothetical protein
MVFTDASFHHAAEPVRLAQVAYRLLRSGGALVLFREPTLSLLRRRREHGVEGEHGSFEREYSPDAYLKFLRRAGFRASKFRAAGGFSTIRSQTIPRPPLSWLNGVLFSEFTYVGRKP